MAMLASASVRELMREQEQRRQAAMSGASAAENAAAAPVFKAPQVGIFLFRPLKSLQGGEQLKTF